ncbi:hypothetical protein [Curvibacter phage PCA1]|nr:hypothetical protein [Curvibacter phage PCA1]
MTLREEFEAWHKQAYGFVGKIVMFAGNSTYVTTTTRTRWEAWQAAHEAKRKALDDLRVAADKALRALQSCVIAMNGTRIKEATFDAEAVSAAIKALEGQGAGVAQSVSCFDCKHRLKECDRAPCVTCVHVREFTDNFEQRGIL